ncbi:MoaF N-terminal domain-containing protein [Eudoraea chungangensis]|uniref:MoaF N-terminal domain-containing protein n=1 Tax=Eudoraea chungangensis TaxID=1481905 RepID=UPI0023EB40ED|nr:MoaF N-terminal domain-containing protein [Eudoraea chungangensis]
MKKLTTIILVFVAISFQAIAQDEERTNLLDGTSMDYTYENGGGVHADFVNGNFNYKWTAGPNEGVEGSEDYMSKKIGDKLYMIGFMVEANKSYVTIVFNFKKKVFSTSAILSPGTDKEMILFEGGIIKQVVLKEQ